MWNRAAGQQLRGQAAPKGRNLGKHLRQQPDFDAYEPSVVSLASLLKARPGPALPPPLPPPPPPLPPSPPRTKRPAPPEPAPKEQLRMVGLRLAAAAALLEESEQSEQSGQSEPPPLPNVEVESTKATW